jgi:predicted site-specific integrase-resolvase
MQKLFKLTEFAEKIGYSRRTVFKMIKDGELKPYLKRNNHNYFSMDQVLEFTSDENDTRKVVAYARVSSNSQKSDLKSQIQLLETYSVSKGIIIDEYIKEIGSGINFKRKKFLKLITDLLKGEIQEIIITYEDRLVRFAFDLISFIADLNGTKITVINIKTSSPQEELVEDLMTVIHVFSSRLYGLRRNKKKIERFANAYKED